MIILTNNNNFGKLGINLGMLSNLLVLSFGSKAGESQT